jgi:hypothetical protein
MPARIGTRRNEGVEAAIVRVSHARIPLSLGAVVASLNPARVGAEQSLAESDALGFALLAVLHNVAVINDDDLYNDVVILVEFSEVSHDQNVIEPEPVHS